METSISWPPEWPPACSMSRSAASTCSRTPPRHSWTSPKLTHAASSSSRPSSANLPGRATLGCRSGDSMLAQAGTLPQAADRWGATLTAVPERPTADEYLQAFDGRILGPVVPENIVEVRPAGCGAYNGQPSQLALAFSTGPRKEEIVVQVGLWPDRITTILHDLLFGGVRGPRWWETPPRFPLTIERGKTKVAVDGRERVFTTYTVQGRNACAMVSVRGLSVAVSCAPRRLNDLALATLDADEVRRIFR